MRDRSKSGQRLPKKKIRRLKELYSFAQRLREQEIKQMDLLKRVEVPIVEVERAKEPMEIKPMPEHFYTKPENERPPGLEGLSTGDIILLETDGALTQEQLKWFRKKDISKARTYIPSEKRWMH